MAERIDSASALVLEGWANFYFDQKKYAEAERYLIRVLADPDAAVCMSCARDLLGTTYLETGRFVQAEAVFRSLVADDPTHAHARISLGKVLALTGRTAEAETEFRKSAELLGPPGNPDLGTFYYWMAYVWAHQGQWERAFEFFEKSLIGYDDYNWLQIDPDFGILRERPEWKPLMKKYFPEKVRD